MLLLVTGASGAGKSTIRQNLAPALAPAVVCVELRHVDTVPAWPTIDWRQRATERAVQLALTLQRAGRHLLLSGDPVATAEVIAAPSAPALDGIAACLLDVAGEAQAVRLGARGDDPALLHHHQAFAEWMRRHADDPRHNLHVLQSGGWDSMRWERLSDPGLRWSVHTIDTTERSPAEVSAEVIGWSRHVLDGTRPRMQAPTGGSE